MKIVAAITILTCADAAVAGLVQSGNSGTLPASLLVARTILWNQSTTNFNGVVDQDFPDFPDYSAGMVDDFSTGGQTWNITRITTYYSQATGAWTSDINAAHVSLFAKTGGMPGPGDFVGNLGVVSATLVNLGGAWSLSADTSGIDALHAINGEYWIGLTPVADFTTYGQEFHLLSADPTIGAGSAVRNIGGSFGFGTDWYDAGSLGQQPNADMLFTLEGDIVPAPDVAALFVLGGVFKIRRRR